MVCIYSMVYGIVLYHTILHIYDELEYTSQYCTILFGPILRCTMLYYILRSEKYRNAMAAASKVILKPGRILVNRFWVSLTSVHEELHEEQACHKIESTENTS